MERHRACDKTRSVFWRAPDPRHDPASFVVALRAALMRQFDQEAPPEPLRSAFSGMHEPAVLEGIEYWLRGACAL